MTYRDPQFTIPSFELPPSAERGCEFDEFSSLLTGMNDLASVSQMSRIDFFFGTLEEMQKRDLELDDFKMRAILQEGFGSPEEALDWMGATDFSEHPDGLEEVLRWYTKDATA